MQHIFKSFYISFLLIIVTIPLHSQNECDDPDQGLVQFEVQNINAQTGDKIFVDINFKEVTNLEFFQFTISWNPSALEFCGCDGDGGPLQDNSGQFSQISCNTVFINTDELLNQGFARVIWGSSDALPYTAPVEPVPIFTISFNVIGDPSEAGNISIGSEPLGFEAGGVDPDTGEFFTTEEFCQEGGTVSVECDNSELEFFVNTCGTSVPMGGSADFFLCGNDFPYTYVVFAPDNSEAGSGTVNAPVEFESLSMLSSGQYTVSFTGADGVLLPNQEFEILNTSPLTVTLDKRDLTCIFDNPSGIITATIDGGEAPYTYIWGDVNISQAERRNLSAGDYFITVEDVNGCSATNNITLTVPDTIKLVGEVVNNPIPCAESDFSVSAEATGGLPDNLGRYEYQVFSAASGAIVDFELAQVFTFPNSDNDVNSALVPGETYYLRVKDFGPRICRSDSIFFTIPITPQIIEYTITSNVESVFDCNTGVSSGQLSLDINPPPFLLFNDLSIFDAVTGDLFMEVPMFRYDTRTIDNLPPGDYTLLFTDRSGGCTGEDSFSVQAATGGMIDVDIATESFGGCDPANVNGNIIVNFSPLPDCLCNIIITDTLTNTVVRQTASASNRDIEINGLGGGDYRIDITDLGGCMITGEFSIAGEGLDAAIQILPVSGCDIDLGGIFSVDLISSIESIDTFSVTDQAGNIISSGNMANLTSLEIDSLPAGDYMYFIGNIDDCSSSDSFTIGMTQGFNIDTTTVQTVISPGCNPEGDLGSIQFSVTGGVDPIEYAWNDGITTSIPLRTDLMTGLYSVTITDGTGCMEEINFDPLIAGTGDLSVDEDDIIATNPACRNDTNGSIMILTTGGDENLTFAINNGIPTINPLFSNLDTGAYSITVTDTISGCIGLFSRTLVNPDFIALEMENVSLVRPGCSTVTGEGSITINPTGGTPPYRYAWDDANSIDSNIRENLLPMVYVVTITDANNCEFSRPISLIAVDDIDFPAFTVSPPMCQGQNSGTIEFEDPDSIIQGLVLLLLNGNTLDFPGNTATGLAAQSYTVFINYLTDCTVEPMAIDVPTSDPIALEFTSTMMPDCASGLGDITVGIVGGAQIDSVQWDDPNTSTTESLTNIGAGTYNVTVTDINGCEAIDSYELVAVDAIDVSLAGPVEGVFCFENNDGLATAMATGGNFNDGIYQWIWSDGSAVGTQSTSTNSTLGGGPQWVIATDGVCTSDTFFFNVPAPEPVQFFAPSLQIPTISCFNDSMETLIVSAIGGGNANSLYTYTWENLENTLSSMSGRAEGVGAGRYVATITNNDTGCSGVDTVVIDGPDELLASVDSTLTQDISCNVNTGFISVNASGGTGDLSFNWTNDVSTENTADLLRAGLYNITVSDANNCEVITSYELTSPTDIEFSIADFVDPVCVGETTCVGVTGISGGVGGYRFTINNGGLLPIDSCFSLLPNTYSISVFDSDGCSNSQDFIINSPPELTVELGEDVVVDLGVNANIEANVGIAGAAIDTIIWGGNFQFICRTGDCSSIEIESGNNTQIQVQVIDENGCVAFDDIDLIVSKTRSVYIPNVFAPGTNVSNQINRSFRIFPGNGADMVITLQIYDRWGELVYAEDNLPVDAVSLGVGNWNGDFKGKRVKPGVFSVFTKILFKDGQEFPYRATVTLLD